MFARGHQNEFNWIISTAHFNVPGDGFGQTVYGPHRKILEILA
jgi:hypothetical protein